MLPPFAALGVNDRAPDREVRTVLKRKRRGTGDGSTPWPVVLVIQIIQLVVTFINGK